LTRLIHTRGDVSGMFLFLLAFLFGLWQIVVARKRLNGMSLTGYPDRKWVSYAAGAAIIAGSCAWYFSKKNHFASPDLEGIETLFILVFALICSTLVQCVAAQVAGLLRAALGKRAPRSIGPSPRATRELPVNVGGDLTPAAYREAEPGGGQGLPLLLLHDYAGSRRDVSALAEFLAAKGHATLAPDLDGHGDSPRRIGDPAMVDLLDAASRELMQASVSDSFGVVGVGFGGTLALDLAISGIAERAVAVDPPALDEEGYPDVSTLREFRPEGILAATFKPPAMAENGKRVSLSRLLTTMPEPEEGEHKGHSTVIGTRAPWLNEPEALTDYSSWYSPFSPVLIKGTHLSLQLEEGTLEFLAGTID
jgi:pimeloyl-ACP methyl ester carboxylesterase